MRIISGMARGKKLKELAGDDTRPTTDRVKEGLFNIVQFDIEGRRILDLFAGTGQLGLECLSRGAREVVFVDMRREAVAQVRENLALTGFSDRAQVHQSDYLAFLSRCKEKFDLIFLDPPYDTGLLEKAAELVAGIDILSEHGIMVCESTALAVLPQLAPPYEMGRQYRYGKILLTLYRRACDA